MNAVPNSERQLDFQVISKERQKLDISEIIPEKAWGKKSHF